MKVAEETAFAMGIKLTGDPDATNPPFNQSQLQTLASNVQSDLSNRLTDPHPTLTVQQQQDVDALSRALVAVKNYVEQVANAKAKGNRAIFETIADRIGFASKQTVTRHQRIFEALPAEQGSFHIHVPSEGSKGQGVTFTYEYGFTNAKNVPPTAWQKSISLPVADLIVTGLPSGSLIGIHYAAILHPQHTAQSDAKALPTSKVAVMTPANKAGKATLAHGVDYLHFSDIIYLLIP